MTLTLYVGVKRYRHSRSRLVVALYRDGILYFVYIFRKQLPFMIPSDITYWET